MLINTECQTKLCKLLMRYELAYQSYGNIIYIVIIVSPALSISACEIRLQDRECVVPTCRETAACVESV